VGGNDTLLARRRGHDKATAPDTARENTAVTDHTIAARTGRWSACPEALSLDPDVTDAGARLYTVLARYVGRGGQKVWPYERTVADRLGWSESTVRRAMANLVAAGWIHRRRRAGTSSLTWICREKGEAPGWAQQQALPVKNEMSDSSNLPGASGQICAVQRNESHRTKTTERAAPHPAAFTYADAAAMWPGGLGGKNDAPREWARALRRHGHALTFAADFMAWVERFERQGNDPRFCPSLVKWLRNDGWEEPPAGPRDTPRATTAAPADRGAVALYDRYGNRRTPEQIAELEARRG
jgi:hypothetical protein